MTACSFFILRLVLVEQLLFVLKKHNLFLGDGIGGLDLSQIAFDGGCILNGTSQAVSSFGEGNRIVVDWSDKDWFDQLGGPLAIN